MKKADMSHIVYEFSSIYDAVKQQSERYGDRVKYVYKVNKEEKTINYIEFKEHVDYIAAALKELGLQGKTVAVTGETHPDYVATYFATVSTSGVIVPLDKDILKEQFEGFVSFANIEAIFYTKAMHKKMLELSDTLTDVKYFVGMDLDADEEMKDRFVHFEEILEKGKAAYEAGSHPAEETVQDVDKLCAILFTSGTTGTSKGVMLTQKNLCENALAALRAVPVVDGDKCVSVLPVHHAYSFTCEHIAFPNVGAYIYINDSIKNTIRSFNKVQPNILFLVPLYLETMYKKVMGEIEKKGKTKTVKTGLKISRALLKVGIDVRRKLFKEVIDGLGGKLQYIVCGGAPLRSDVLDAFEDFGILVSEGYGITECSPLVSVNPRFARRPKSVGPSVEGTEVMIDLENPEDNTGEILVKGPCVMQGYYKNEEATKAVFTDDGWFKTGDIGYLDEDGFIYITGRKKNLILLSNGKNVFPEELEEYVSSLDEVSEVVVIGRQKDANETAITAIVYPNYELLEGKTKEEIYDIIKGKINDINLKLPLFKHMTEVEIRETEFEKTTTRKIMRFKVK